MAKKAVLRTAQEIFALDKAFFLIEGHPSIVADAANGVEGPAIFSSCAQIDPFRLVNEAFPERTEA
jgi:hypothetical protein